MLSKLINLRKNLVKNMKKIYIIFLLLICIIAFLIINKITIKIKNYNAENLEKEGMRITLLSGATKTANANANGYLIRTKNDKLIVVDGGQDFDAPSLWNYIQEYGNGKVDYWYITHGHNDHCGALITLLEEDYDLIIENLYYSFNDITWYEKYDTRGYEWESRMIGLLNNEKIVNSISCQKDDKIEMDNLECDILRIANPKIINSDNGNDSSMVFKMTATDVDKDIIFLGDIYVYGSEELVKLGKEKLSSYAVQMAHHGQNGATKEVYDLIRPTIAFFNAPEWLYDNDSGGGFNSGPWQSIIVRSWLDEYGTEQIKSFEGDKYIHLTKEGHEIENL